MCTLISMNAEMFNSWEVAILWYVEKGNMAGLVSLIDDNPVSFKAARESLETKGLMRSFQLTCRGIHLLATGKMDTTISSAVPHD